MKVSELIESLAKVISEKGDLHIMNARIADEHGTSETWLLSPDRKDKKGNRARMNHKEFKKYCEENKDAQ